MKKNTRIIVGILIVTLVFLAGCGASPSTEKLEDEREVSINVLIDKEDIDETFTYNTDYKFLLGLLEENEKELGATFEKSDIGTMIIGMMNYEADPDDQEFFLIQINEEDATKGVDEIPLEDGHVYTFELSNY